MSLYLPEDTFFEVVGALIDDMPPSVPPLQRAVFFQVAIELEQLGPGMEIDLDKIARASALSTRIVRRELARLEESGWVERLQGAFATAAAREVT